MPQGDKDKNDKFLYKIAKDQTQFQCKNSHKGYTISKNDIGSTVYVYTKFDAFLQSAQNQYIYRYALLYAALLHCVAVHTGESKFLNISWMPSNRLYSGMRTCLTCH